MRSALILAAVMSVILALNSCASRSVKTEALMPESGPVTSPGGVSANLKQEEAQHRALAISEVTYRLDIDISADKDRFSARSETRFDLIGDRAGLFLDLQDTAKISSVKINGEIVAVEFSHHRLQLPESRLKLGANIVEVIYDQLYLTEGHGLHRFKDPEDGRVYLYSQFEAFDAHRMFPCFDQPDLKGTMAMTVTAPKSWQVISTTRESSKNAAGDNLVWNFPETPKISTYLFSLHAGPYHSWESTAEIGAEKIPLRLFARESLAKFVRPQDWFTPTRSGLKFFSEYFAYPYPFKKYDQAIVPEFNAGAMENVAAVTFSERMIQRGPYTRNDREHIAAILLHEMAHMWFGDLVTMKWWNGLWLNESFATYMSDFALSKVTEFKDVAWMSFFMYSKSEAYEEDQLSTTHPVEGAVADTHSAFANFDSITYGKGASVLKQLNFYLGENAFREGVRRYFKAYAYKNTKIEDFVTSLEHAAKKDLSTWSRAWLRSAGLDTVEAEYTCTAAGRVANFTLRLKGPHGAESERVHKTRVALMNERSGRLIVTRAVAVEYRGDLTRVDELDGAECPDLVQPNEDDQDYVKVRYDARSLKTSEQNLSKVASNLTRLMTYPNLYEMVRDLKLKPQEFLVIANQGLQFEKDEKIFDQITRVLPSAVYYLPRGSQEEQSAYRSWVSRLEMTLWTRLMNAPAGSDWQKKLLSALTRITETPHGVELLAEILEGRRQLKSYVPDTDLKWDMTVRLSSLGAEKATAAIAKMQKEDSSERGVRMLFSAQAAQPSPEVKSKWIARTIEQNDLSYAQKRGVLRSLFPAMQDELRAKWADDYYRRLPNLAATRDLNIVNLYAATMMPAVCTRESADRGEKFIQEQGAALPMPVVKDLKMGFEEDRRCASIREAARLGVK